MHSCQMDPRNEFGFGVRDGKDQWPKPKWAEERTRWKVEFKSCMSPWTSHSRIYKLGNESANRTLVGFSEALRHKEPNFSSEIRVWGALKISLASTVMVLPSKYDLWAAHYSPKWNKISRLPPLQATSEENIGKKRSLGVSKYCVMKSRKTAKNITLFAGVHVEVWALKLSSLPVKPWRQIKSIKMKRALQQEYSRPTATLHLNLRCSSCYDLWGFDVI